MERTSKKKKNLALLHNKMRLCTRLCIKMDKIAWPTVTACVPFHFPRKLAYSPPPLLYPNIAKRLKTILSSMYICTAPGWNRRHPLSDMTNKVLVNPTYHCSPSLLSPTLNSPFCLPRQPTNQLQKWLKQITISMVAYITVRRPILKSGSHTPPPAGCGGGVTLYNVHLCKIELKNKKLKTKRGA